MAHRTRRMWSVLQYNPAIQCNRTLCLYPWRLCSLFKLHPLVNSSSPSIPVSLMPQRASPNPPVSSMSPVNPKRVSFGPVPASIAPVQPVAASSAPVPKPPTPVKNYGRGRRGQIPNRQMAQLSISQRVQRTLVGTFLISAGMFLIPSVVWAVLLIFPTYSWYPIVSGIIFWDYFVPEIIWNNATIVSDVAISIVILCYALIIYNVSQILYEMYLLSESNIISDS
jgi:hypothetical protein